MRLVQDASTEDLEQAAKKQRLDAAEQDWVHVSLQLSACNMCTLPWQPFASSLTSWPVADLDCKQQVVNMQHHG